MSNSPRITLSLAAALLIAFGAGALAQRLSTSYSVDQGMLRDSRLAEEKLDFDLPASHGLYRDVLLIPPEYGERVAITESPAGAVFWFEAADGTVRNVVVKSDLLHIIRRAGALTRAEFPR